jgi:purine-nucleoside phosphorylase
MLKDLSRDDWLGMLDLPSGRIPTALLLRGTRNLRRNADRHRALFTDVVEVGSPNALFEDIFVGRRGGIDVGYASVYGPPMASEIVHLFGVLGTTLVVQTGVCGGLADGLDAGDLVVATKARCAEGAAHCYLPNAVDVAATPALVTVATRDAADHPLLAASVWTTSALLAEGHAEVEAWHAAGYAAVDMETATTFAVADYFGMDRLSVLAVFDNPRHGAHLGLTEAHKDAARAAGERAMLAVAFRAIARATGLPADALAPDRAAAQLPT